MSQAFRKKPVTVLAEQFFDNRPDLSVPVGVCVCIDVPHGMEIRPHIHTLEGVMLVSNGDWIITGVRGERYPCKPEIFTETYEPAETPDLRGYLERALLRGHIDHAMRASIDPATGGIKFYIHPEGKDGETLDIDLGLRQPEAVGHPARTP